MVRAIEFCALWNFFQIELIKTPELWKPLSFRKMRLPNVMGSLWDTELFFDSLLFSFKKTRLLIKVDDEYIIKIIAMIIDSFKIFSHYGSKPVALKDMHIHMYFFCVRRCRRPVAAADVNFFSKCSKNFSIGFMIMFKVCRRCLQRCSLCWYILQNIFKKIDVRRDYGPSAAADAKEIHMNMHVF